MRQAVVAAVLLLLGTGVSSARELYRIQVLNVTVAAAHEGHPWDGKPPVVTSKRKGGTCCFGGAVADGEAPDLQVTATLGHQRMMTHVVNDKVEATFEEYSYMVRDGAEPLVVEVADRDGEGQELIGRAELRFESDGRLQSTTRMKFGEVERIEVSAERVPSARTQFTVGSGEVDQPTPLYVLAGQRVSLQATGSMCIGAVCGGPGGLSRGTEGITVNGSGTAGTLYARVGDALDVPAEKLASSVSIAARSPGRLRFLLTTPNGVRLDGSYTVHVALEP